MFTFLAVVIIGILLLVAIPLMLAFAVVGVVFKLLFWILLLPFRLLFLPLRLLGGLFRVAFGVLLLPILLIGAVLVGAMALIGGLLSLVLPLVPLLLIGALIWAISRASRHPTAPIA